MEAVASSRPWLCTATADIRPSFPGLSRRKDLAALGAAAQDRIAELAGVCATLVYTDGAAGRRHGAGAFWVDPTGALPLPSSGANHAGLDATSYQSEAVGVRTALNAVLQAAMKTPGADSAPVAIFTDSQSLLRRLTRGELRQTTQDCRQIWACIRRLQQLGYDVYLQYVPGHVGIPGNEEADRVAGEAADAHSTNPAVDSITHRLLRGAATAACRQRARDVLHAATTGTTWARVTGGRRVGPNPSLRRAGERVIGGLSCGQHAIAVPTMKATGQGPRTKHEGAPVGPPTRNSLRLVATDWAHIPS
eukprot:TRINITY_DN8206_c0_g2_i3.p1 TRINITY_DN8206_c0_g2~~TRINITY_DN8206_c0_g2_i3.p1  ORF type:complete len:326 (-),score=29.42 TRINITY_DN8206_c0_g2_i3:42-959(-)